MEKHRIICLTIGGFDPSGGAGLLADCKVFEQFKIQGMAIQTCNTIQTEDQFLEVVWTPQSIILHQLETLLKRYKIQFVKIGLIENTTVLLSVLERLRIAPKMTIVWDPVLKPSASNEINENRFTENITKILPLIDLITPNLPEYNVLFSDERQKLVSLKIYLKGGHASIPGKDQLFWNDKIFPFKLNTKNCTSKHGSGCILSSAILCNIAKGYPTIKGLRKAKDYVERCLSSNSSLLSYHKF
jgi:hydroxymethylpyrimidine/phosphomethylpyrimidine kinase